MAESSKNKDSLLTQTFNVQLYIQSSTISAEKDAKIAKYKLIYIVQAL